MSRFFDEFKIKSANKYPMLKFKESIYYEDRRLLVVKFIVSVYDASLITESDEAQIKKIVEEIIPDVNIDVVFERTLADADVVTTRLFQFFKDNYPAYFNYLKKENLNVTVEDGLITVEIKFEKTLAKIIEDKEPEIEEFLSKNFNSEIDVKILEMPNNTDDELVIDRVIYEHAKVITVKEEKKLYSRFRSSGAIGGMPTYISEIKGAAEGVTLCGKVSNISFREYQNKRYDGVNKKEPEKLKLYKWTLNDTTKSIECVAFPSLAQEPMLDALQDNLHVLCYGNVTDGRYGGLQYTVSDIALATIDFSSIKNEEASKPVPKGYSFVFPKPYEELNQASLFDTQKEITCSLKDKSYVVFDFETTGLTVTDKIIEIGAVKIVNGKITETFDTLINPEMPIPKGASDVNHITDEMVELSPTFETVAADFYRFTYGSALVAHNIAFDFSFLYRQSKECGYIYKDIELIDTLALARTYVKGTKVFNLGSLTKLLGISLEDAHRALADTVATAKLFIELCKLKDGTN